MRSAADQSSPTPGGRRCATYQCAGQEARGVSSVCSRRPRDRRRALRLDHASPFMLETCRVNSPFDLPAITHVDGSAACRPSTADQSPLRAAAARVSRADRLSDPAQHVVQHARSADRLHAVGCHRLLSAIPARLPRPRRFPARQRRRPGSVVPLVWARRHDWDRRYRPYTPSCSIRHEQAAAAIVQPLAAQIAQALCATTGRGSHSLRRTHSRSLVRSRRKQADAEDGSRDRSDRHLGPGKDTGTFKRLDQLPIGVACGPPSKKFRHHPAVAASFCWESRRRGATFTIRSLRRPCAAKTAAVPTRRPRCRSHRSRPVEYHRRHCAGGRAVDRLKPAISWSLPETIGALRPHLTARPAPVDRGTGKHGYRGFIDGIDVWRAARTERPGHVATRRRGGARVIVVVPETNLFDWREEWPCWSPSLRRPQHPVA